MPKKIRNIYDLPGTYVIKDVRQARALMDPVRIAIFNIIGWVPNNIADMAKMLNIKQTALYYHVNELEKLGLLQVVKTVQKRNLVEKFYLPVARQMRVDESLLAQPGMQGRDGLDESLKTIFEITRQDLQRIVQKGYNPFQSNEALMTHLEVALTPQAIKAFKRDLEVLCKKYLKMDESSKGRKGFTGAGLSLVFYPEQPLDERQFGNRFRPTLDKRELDAIAGMAGVYQEESPAKEKWEFQYRKGRLMGKAEWGSWEMVAFGGNCFRVKAWPDLEFRFEIGRSGVATGFKEYKTQFKLVSSGHKSLLVKAWPDPEFRLEGKKNANTTGVEAAGPGKVTKVFRKIG